jgi:hypothetical protein
MPEPLQPKPRLSSTYEYRPQPPVAPRNPQTQQQPNNINGTYPVAENRPAPQGPVNNIPAANGNPQATLHPKPQLNDTYQYRAAAPTPNKPVPPRTIQPQPQPKPPMNSTNGPIQTAPAAPNNSQIPAQPKPQLNANGPACPQYASPEEAIPTRPVAPQPPARANPQPVIRDAASRKAPIEIRQIPQKPSLTPQQQAAKQNNGQPPAARIIEITPLNQPTPIAQPNRATPPEPTQGS